MKGKLRVVAITIAALILVLAALWWTGFLFPVPRAFENVQATYQEAPATITLESDGQEIHVNLVKFVGAVSLGTTVTVNNTAATVASDGSYYAFLDLPFGGKNTIDVTETQGTAATTRSIAVTFSPPLFVLLDNDMQFNEHTNYRRTPLKVTGIVSDPRAEVTVNGYRAKVAEDGSFSARIRLTQGNIQAVGRLGDQVDEDSELFGFSGGKLYPIPMVQHPQLSYAEISPSATVNLKAGESSSLDYVIHARKDVFRSDCDVSIKQIRDTSGTTEPNASELSADVTPSNFGLYPNVNYHSTIDIKTSVDLTPGKYLFQPAFSYSRFSMINPVGALGTLQIPGPLITVVVGPSLGQLDGTHWALRSIDGEGLVTGSYISLYFRSGQAHGYSGCNTYGGKYTVESSGKVRFTDIVSTLLLASSPEVNSQETRYLAVLSSAESYRIAGKELTLNDPSGQGALVFMELPSYTSDPSELVNTRWRLVSIGGTPVGVGLDATLSFDDSGGASGTSGPFEYAFKYEAQGDDIWWTLQSVKRVTMTTAPTDVEASHFVGALGFAATYRIVNSQLEVFTITGDRDTLVFEAVH